MTRKLIIAVDIDDVLVETAPLLVAYYNKKYGTKIGLKDMYSHELTVWGVADEKTAIERVENYLKTDEFQQAAPLRSAIMTIMRLAKQFEFHAVTGRTDFLETATKNMLESYFPDLFRSVEFTGFFGDKAVSKAEVCRRINASVLIEDHLKHALEVADVGIEVLLFGDYPWNKTNKLPYNIHRVKNWKEVEDYLNAKS